MKRRNSGQQMRGFSLVEVLVALVVIGVGLLGVVKIQALALSGTGTARMRSQVAFAAASLAATMHADRAYWANITADPAVNVSVPAAAVTASDSNLLTPPIGGCTATNPCETTMQVAAQDLHDWAASLRTILPAGAQAMAAVNCQIADSNPVTCAIHISWTEHLVSTTYATNTLTTAQQNAEAVRDVEQTSYTLYSEP